jgi:hypothetical protein
MARKTMYPVNMAELYGSTVFGTLSSFLSDTPPVLVDDEKSVNATLVARSWCLWEKNFCTATPRTDAKRQSLQQEMRRCLELRDNNYAEAERYVRLQANVHPADWYYSLLNLTNEPFITQRQYLSGLHTIAMGLFFQSSLGERGYRIPTFRPILLRMIFERAARYIPQISLHDCLTVDTAIPLLLSKAGHHLENQLRLWAFILDVLQHVFSYKALLEDPLSLPDKLVALRKTYQNMHGLLPLCLAVSPTSNITELTVAETCYRGSLSGRTDLVDCSLLTRPPTALEDDHKYQLRALVATNQQRVLDEAKKLQEMTAKLSLHATVPAPAETLPEPSADMVVETEVPPSPIPVFTWDMLLGLNHEHVHAQCQVRRVVRVCVRKARDDDLPATRGLMALLHTKIGQSTPFGHRRLRTILSFVCTKQMRQALALPPPDYNNTPRDLLWADPSQSMPLSGAPVPKPAATQNTEPGLPPPSDIQYVSLVDALEHYSGHRANLRRIIDSNQIQIHGLNKRLCCICLGEVPNLKVLHAPITNSTEEEWHAVCKDCFPLVARGHICPLCRRAI